MTSLLAVLWYWKVASGLVAVAALAWLILAVFVAWRWPVLHPVMARFRTSPWKALTVGLVVVALVAGAVLASREAFAHARSGSRTRSAVAARHRVERRIVLAQPGRWAMVHSLGQPRAMAEVSRFRLVSPHLGDMDVDVDLDVGLDVGLEIDDGCPEEMSEAREAALEAREAAREAIEQAREAHRRALELSRREMERAGEILERMGDEVEVAGDEEELLEDEATRSRLGALLDRQAERVENLGRALAGRLRELGDRFDDEGEDDDEDQDQDARRMGSGD